MSLAFDFKLTTAQTRLLVTIANYHLANCDGTDDPKFSIPVWSSPKDGGLDHFVSIAKRLCNKGLVSHDPRRSPTYQPTAEGLAIASLVVHEAQMLVDLTKGVEARKKKYTAKIEETP